MFQFNHWCSVVFLLKLVSLITDMLVTLALQDEDSEAVLAADFEIGHFIRERIVPRAVLYFTGEAIEDDDDDVSTHHSLCVMASSLS